MPLLKRDQDWPGLRGCQRGKKLLWLAVTEQTAWHASGTWWFNLQWTHWSPVGRVRLVFGGTRWLFGRFGPSSVYTVWLLYLNLIRLLKQLKKESWLLQKPLVWWDSGFHRETSCKNLTNKNSFALFFPWSFIYVPRCSLHHNSCPASEKSVRSTVIFKRAVVVAYSDKRGTDLWSREEWISTFYPFQNPESASLITRPKHFEEENDAGEGSWYRFLHTSDQRALKWQIVAYFLPSC